MRIYYDTIDLITMRYDMTQTVLLDVANGVATITLNRPEVLNAWDRPMRQRLVALLGQAEADPEVRAIILTGAGERAFGAGQDLEEAQRFSGERAEEWVGEWEELYEAMRTLSKPVVAALNGLAVGSAFQFALLADFRIGHPRVKLGQPEIDSGIPSTTGPWIMREMIGLAHTIDLTLSGRLIEADEALRLGLLSRVVPAERVMDEAVDLARKLAAKPAGAMRLNKQRFREMTEAGFRDALSAGLRLQSEAFAGGEPAAMIERFLAKRSTRK